VTRCSQTHRRFTYALSHVALIALQERSFALHTLEYRFASKSKMRTNLFRSKKSLTWKGKTIKKPEPVDGRRSRRALQNECDTRDSEIVDISTVSDWVKESAIEKADDAGRRARAVLKDSKRPCRATLVNGIGARSDVATEDTVSEGSELPRRQMVDLLVGHQHKSSPYFTQKYFCVPEFTVPNSSTRVSANSSSSLELLPELDPHAVELYQIWLHTGAVPFRCQGACCSSPTSDSGYIWQACWPLINTHILGCAIDASEFSDQVMNLLQEKTRNAPQVDTNTINHVFSENESKIGIPDVLRRFTVDRYIDAGIESGFDDLDIPGLPPKFVHTMLDAVLRRLSPADPAGLPSSCEYHIHEVSRTCYKLSVQPTIMRREQKLEPARENSRKDSEEVLKNADTNGFQTVDWEQRRVEAMRALMEQRGCRRIGFHRLSEPRPIETGAVISTGEAAVEKHHELPDTSKEGQAEASTSAGNVLGTALTNSPIDDVLSKARSREPPPPPAFTELPRSESSNTNHSDKSPEYVTNTTTLNSDTATSMSMVSDGSTPRTSDPRSSLSAPDSDLRQDMELTLKLEKNLSCPGAFPVSRDGSLKSVILQDLS
jgi:hypothetical protein